MKDHVDAANNVAASINEKTESCDLTFSRYRFQDFSARSIR
jgi:hypothetical protein